MNTTHRTAAIALGVVAVLASSCGSSKEKGLEQLIEQQTGNSVDLDINPDGGISIQSEDGSFSIDEDGNFVVVDENGKVITGDVDADGNSINIQSDEGNVVIEGDGESGSVNVSGDDGNASFQTGTEIPAEWPADIPQPSGLADIAGSTFTDGSGTAMTVNGFIEGDPVSYVDAYGASIAAAGIPQTGRFLGQGTITMVHENDSWVVTVSGVPDGDKTLITVFVTPPNS